MNWLYRTSCRTRSTLLAAALSGMMLCAAPALAQLPPPGVPGRSTAELNVSPMLKDIGIEQNLNAQLPMDAVFTDDYGQTVKLGDLYGKRPAVLVMVYYECPMLCNMVLNDLLRTMNGITTHTIGQEFDVIAVSINPNESPEVAAKKKRTYMKAYGERGTPAGWHFLTGTQENITRVAQTVGFKYRYDEARKEYIHASGIMVTTTDGRLSQYFYGIDYSPTDLRLAITTANKNKVGGLVDAVLLYCFHYDPTTGKYGFVIMNALKLGGILTVLALAIFMTIMLMRDRRALPPPTVGAGHS